MCDAKKKSVKEFYGNLKTEDFSESLNETLQACNRPKNALPKKVREALKNVHDEVQNRYFGCGLCIPPALEGATVLDLGCGAGRDAFAISQLVGESGKVIGVDMTQELLKIGESFKEWHRQKAGQKVSNVEFKHGFIEKLDELGFSDNSVDVMISNGVICLTAVKEDVFREVARVLKPGGEIYFSDCYGNKQVSKEAQESDKLWGDGAGAMVWSELGQICEKLGLSVPYMQNASPYKFGDNVQELLGDRKFAAVTWRIIKKPQNCEKNNNGSWLATYNGGMEEICTFQLAQNIKFPKSKPILINSEIFAELQSSRYAKFFSFEKIEEIMPQQLNPFEFT